MRLSRVPTLAVLLVAAAVGSAAPPDLDVPAELRATGQYARLAPKTTAVAVTYVGLDGVDPIPPDLLKDPKLFLLDTRGLAKGRYRFAAVAAGATGEQARADFVLVVGVDPVPPGPQPNPGPQPGPVTPTQLWGVVIVEETDALVAERGRLFADPALSALMRAKGYRFRIVDRGVQGVDGQPPADVKRFLDASAGKAYPQAFVVDTKGAAVWSGPLPADPAGLVAELKKWGLP